jgi:hypothetical protein
MLRMLRRSASLPVLFALLLVLAACGDDDPDGEPDTAPQERVEELEQENEALEGELGQLRDRLDAVEQENEELEDELATVREALPDVEPSDDQHEANADEAAPIEWSSEVADAWTAEGLIDQLHLHLTDPQAEAAMPEGWDPGMTAWVPFEVPDEVRGVYDTPGDVMAELAAVVDAPLLGYDQWEVTFRVLLDEDEPDLAYGALLGWGFLDDSVVGRDIRVTLTRTDDEQWEPGGAERRQHCMRGVSGDRTGCR